MCNLLMCNLLMCNLLTGTCWLALVDWHLLTGSYWLALIDWHLLNDIYWKTLLEIHFLKYTSWMKFIEWHFLNEIYWMTLLEWNLLNDTSWMKFIEWHFLNQSLISAVHAFIVNHCCLLSLVTWNRWLVKGLHKSIYPHSMCVKLIRVLFCYVVERQALCVDGKERRKIKKTSRTVAGAEKYCLWCNWHICRYRYTCI